LIRYLEIGKPSFSTSKKLYQLIKKGDIICAGYMPGKIYGRLDCASGKRMSPANRIFFKSALEAAATGYRPCGNCMREEYKLWKNKQQQ